MSEDYLHLKIAGYAKKTAALGKIETAKRRLTVETDRGEFTKHVEQDPKILTLAGFCEFAGLGPNFLNGKSHRDTTKPEIKQFLAEIVTKVQKTATRPQQVANKRDDRARVKELEIRCKRLGDLLHFANELLSEKRREIKNLRMQIPPRVVAIRKH